MTSQARPVFKLVHSTARTLAMRAVLEAPDGYVVTIKPATRSLDQNAKLHAVLQDIAAAKEWGGCRRTVSEWKTIMVSAWMHTTGRHSEVIQGIEGEPVQLRRSTTTLSKAEMSELIEMVVAWCAQNGVKLRDAA